MERDQRDELNEKRAGTLIGLVRRYLPLEVRVKDLPDVWRLYGPALLARQAGTLEAMFALRPLNREADALVLLRTLYEHGVTFAWLAADPGIDRIGRFRKSDLVSRIELDKDMQKLNEPALAEDVRRRFERERDALPGSLPKLEKLTEDADRRWRDVLPGWEEGTAKTYRGLYASAYRRQSMVAHPSEMGLNFVAADLPDGAVRVQLEQQDPETRGPFGLSVIVVAFSLYIASHSLGWPRTEEINAVFD